MKIMKWICWYGFFGLLLAGGGLWCGYCGWTVNRLEAQAADASFIDLALKSVSEAQAVLDRTEQFRGYLEKGIWFCVAVLGLLALLIFSQVFMAKRKNRPQTVKTKPVAAVQHAAAPSPAEPVAEAPVEEAAPEQPAAETECPRFCTECGKPCEGESRFCVHCGTKLF